MSTPLATGELVISESFFREGGGWGMGKNIKKLSIYTMQSSLFMYHCRCLDNFVCRKCLYAKSSSENSFWSESPKLSSSVRIKICGKNLGKWLTTCLCLPSACGCWGNFAGQGAELSGASRVWEGLWPIRHYAFLAIHWVSNWYHRKGSNVLENYAWDLIFSLMSHFFAL